ncbi:MAG: 3-dehydroquinate synthase [Candidatus Gastranaerophilales bacterium]|nr:3-dehydroquinate synthase [Candidatus Gastranaerophilales bacterium]
MKILNVNINRTETSYPIFTGEGLRDKVKEFLTDIKKAVLVTNETIFEIYQDKITDFFNNLPVNVEYCIIPDGEEYKNKEILEKILTCAFEQHLERNDMFIAFGGGVVGDITGFAASTYLRGIKFLQIPTTILAQVDSSVGGKVAINTPYGKNLLGSFYHPVGVVSDIKFLQSLPKREILTGLSEVVKYSLIEKNCGLEFTDFAKYLSENNKKLLSLTPENIEFMVENCCRLKASVVNQDEKEKGLRAILNFGHTIGHSIEKCTNYNTFTHGEAVAMGMKGALLISLKLNKIDKNYFDFATGLLNSFGLLNYKIPQNVSIENLLDSLKFDKKVKNGNVRFVLPVGYCEVEIFDDVSKDIIEDVLKELY